VLHACLDLTCRVDCIVSTNGGAPNNADKAIHHKLQLLPSALCPLSSAIIVLPAPFNK